MADASHPAPDRTDRADALSVATPATSRAGNTSPQAARRAGPGRDGMAPTAEAEAAAAVADDADDATRLEAMLAQAERLAAQMRGAASGGSQDGSSLGPESGSASGASPAAPRLDSGSGSLCGAAAADAASVGGSGSHSQRSAGLGPPEDAASGATPQSQAEQAEVEAALHSSRLMAQALQALDRSERDLAATEAAPEEPDDDDDDAAAPVATAGAGSYRHETTTMTTAPPSAPPSSDGIVWDKTEYAQEGDDDYVPVVDYSRGDVTPARGAGPGRGTQLVPPLAAAKNVTPDTPRDADAGGITWHKIDAPTCEDDDYVPLADYSRLPPAPAVPSPAGSSDGSAAASPFPLSRQGLYRRQTLQRRRQRRAWMLRALAALLLLMAVCFLFGLLAGEDGAATKAAPATSQQQQQPQREPVQIPAESSDATVDTANNAEAQASSAADDQANDQAKCKKSEQAALKGLPRFPRTAPVGIPRPWSYENKSESLCGPREDVQQQTSGERDPGPTHGGSTMGAVDGPCNARKTGATKANTMDSTDKPHARVSQAVGACQMAFAEWLLPMCREAKYGAGAPVTNMKREDNVYALVQSMMQ